MYLHIYYNHEKAIMDEVKLHKKILKFKEEIESEKCNPKNEKQYKKYFDITKTAKNGIVAKAKENIILEAKSQYGYFVLISNDVKDPIKALEIYRNKD